MLPRYSLAACFDFRRRSKFMIVVGYFDLCWSSNLCSCVNLVTSLGKGGRIELILFAPSPKGASDTYVFFQTKQNYMALTYIFCAIPNVSLHHRTSCCTWRSSARSLLSTTVRNLLGPVRSSLTQTLRSNLQHNAQRSFRFCMPPNRWISKACCARPQVLWRRYLGKITSGLGCW
jgi:hypothetical protein